MHLHFEKNTNTRCDCSILSLSWMGKVPDDIPEEEGWKLNRTNYYQEGWLATGNVRGIVGVTFTTSHCKKNIDYPQRTNYNLRGHRSDVILVKWNEPYQKLASCDSSGIIFVWIKYEGRWSVELINDRNTPVTHFSWSHDGRMALICYQDGFVLVGSVAGQRYWSSMLNLDATITCGIWTPDDQQVYFGTTQGQIIVMDVHGAMVSQVQLCSDVGITAMAWSCEKFKMEEGEEAEPGVTNASKRTFVLAVSFQNGYIYLLKSYDDVSPCQINTGMDGNLGLIMEWSNSRELLAVAGSEYIPGLQLTDTQGAPLHNNLLKFYTESGSLLYTAHIPNTTSCVSALTWGHNDKRIFIATGTQIHIAWVSRRVASLQLFCRLQVQACLASEALLPKLPLPSRIKLLIGNLFAQTIRCCVPNVRSLRDFVSRPPACSTRLHCTMIRHEDENNQSSGTCYTLYLEFLGGLVPLLKGKRTSKIRPEFVIFDPQIDETTMSTTYSSDSTTTKSSSTSSHSTSGTNGRSDSSDTDVDDGCRGSPRVHRKRKTRAKKKNQSDKSSESNEANEELAYLDTLPEHGKLVEVTSNIWGTKFKIHGLAKTIPANLGQVTYKTSLLHLQPRQMTLVVTELRDDFPAGPDPNFNPNIFSEDEEEQLVIQNHKASVAHRRLTETAPPIAPMSPRPNRFPSRNRKPVNASMLATTSTTARPSIPSLGPLARAESYEDDSDTLEVTSNCSKSTENVVAGTPRQGPSYSSLVSQYSRPSSASSNQSRAAISPLYCEGSVPTLQSPKNAVAPSDIIFDRPPAGQTTLMSYSSNTDYSNNVVQVKNALISSDHSRASNAHVNPVPLNLNLNLERVEAKNTNSTTNSTKDKNPSKRKDLLFIDEETPTSSITPPIENGGPSSVDSSLIRRTPTIVSISPAGVPESITRSCSVGYLDNVEMVPSDVALSLLRRDAPNKRLVLVDKKRQKKSKKPHDPHHHHRHNHQEHAEVDESDNQDQVPQQSQPPQKELKKQKFREGGKSKSLDSCDALQDLPNLNKDLNNLFNQMPKLSESNENLARDAEPPEPTLPNTSNKIAAAYRFNKEFDESCNEIIDALNKIHDASARSPLLGRKEMVRTTRSCVICKLISPNAPATENVCIFCRKSFNNNASKLKKLDNECNLLLSENLLSSKPPFAPKTSCSSSNSPSSNSKKPSSSSAANAKAEVNEADGCCSKFLLNNSSSNNNNDLLVKKSPARKNLEIVTSFTDSPLFSRKYRSNEPSTSYTAKLLSANNTPILNRKAEKLKKKEEKEKKIQAASSAGGRVPTFQEMHPVEVTPVEPRASVSLHTQALTTLENIISRLRDLDENRMTPPSSPARLPRSSPASPAPSKKSKRHQSASPIRHILNSPLLNRRMKKKQPTESSDDENGKGDNNNNNSSNGPSDEITHNKQYRDLETFQKAQLRQKLKRGKIEPNGVANSSQTVPVRREFVMHNKAPMWNENSQVYQLDFGGRVTQESAKNFQIEFRGKQVMQFGRIDGNAYTLDFQYPFSALQAFAVALANVTQRLK